MTYYVPAKVKKKKKRNRLIDWLVYIALRGLIAFMSLFSVRRNLKTACFLGRVLWKHYHRGRKRALDNLRASYPGKEKSWYIKTGRRSFEHLAMIAVDVLFTPKLVGKNNWRDCAYFKTVEHAKWLMKEGKGMIMVTGHYANFEIMGYMLGLFGFNVYSIARPLDNPYISKYLYGVREKAGQKIIDKKGATAMMDTLLKQGATVCFIADQDAGSKGLFVDFFGRKASTYKSIGLLAMQYNIPIGVGYSRRVDNKFYFEIGVNRIIMPDEWKDKDDPLLWITQQYTKAIEDFVRAEPSQYWWLHRRWKHRPKDESRYIGTD